MICASNGVVLAVRISGANEHDIKGALEVVDAIPAVRSGRRGRPRRRPLCLACDKGYDSGAFRAALRRRGIKPHIAHREGKKKRCPRRRVSWGERGKRWFVERGFAWLNAYRRLKVRWERSGVMYKAFLLFAVVLICYRLLLQ